jgi:hypothetical protein
MFDRNNLTEEERKELQQLADKIFADNEIIINEQGPDWKRYSALVTKLCKGD